MKKSMMNIAEATGYSNATVHRALKALEIQGMIQIIETKSQRKPNTIYYIGPDDDDVSSLLTRAEIALANLSEATEEVFDVMTQLKETIHLIQPDEQYIQIQ